MNEEKVEGITRKMYHTLIEHQNEERLNEIIKSNIAIYENGVSGEGILNEDILIDRITSNTMKYLKGKYR